MPTIGADGAAAGRSGKGPVLDTARLRVRPLTQADAAPMQLLAGDWGVAEFTARIPHPYPPGAAAEWISSNDDENEVALAIERRSDGAFIGCCGYSPDEPGAVEIGYWVGRPFWKQGFASEAVAALIAHCFSDPAIERVIATVHPDNVASIRLQEKLGFVLTGKRRLDMPARGYE
ncbi:MAG: GNAT family N-acetyltransferase, partial [Dongiaceae bacterium]